MPPTFSPPNELFRLFLLEDDDGLRQSLVRILPRQLRRTTVSSAATIEDGLRLLDTEPSFDLGLLDIRVPLRARMADEANPEVADRLNELKVPFLCFTGFAGSPDATTFLERVAQPSRLVTVIEKSGRPEFFTKLVTVIRKSFVKQASERVDLKLRSLFEPGEGAGHMRSGTATLTTLLQNVLDYWEYLDDATRDSVRHRFLVEEHDGELKRLSLKHRTAESS